VTHDPLWAPWRLSYIKTSPRPEEHACFLCRYRDLDDDRENLVVSRTDRMMVVLNRFPYNNGHLLIAPLAHKGQFDELSEEEMLDSQREIDKYLKILRKSMNPDGFNIGLNLGRVAGAGLPGHLHWHIVPRWNGDTNFMPVIADTKVIPQSLQALYSLLTGELERMMRPPEE
jgi:ATP adenylyltransferase